MRLSFDSLSVSFAFYCLLSCEFVLATPIHDCQPTSSTPTSTSTFYRLTNSILSRIWPIETSHRKCHPKHASAIDLYSDEIVFRFNISSADDVEALTAAADKYFWDIWEFGEQWADIRINKDLVPHLSKILPAQLHQSFAPLIPESTFKSLISSHQTSIPSSDAHDLFFDNYQPLSVINPWLKMLAGMFESHAKLITVGKSYQGRDILGLKLGKPLESQNQDFPRGPRKTILVTGGAHAREWISVSSVNYLLYSLATSYGDSYMHTLFLDEFDWVFVPTINPDGYAYTWEVDRLWKKNRQPTFLRFCNGFDLDRSFGFQFDEGANDNPCAESFPGRDAWEAVEASAIREWARNQTEGGSEIVAFLDLHSYSQQILFPYAFSCDEAPPTLETLEELAYGLSKAIRVASPSGLFYSVSPACQGNVATSKDNSNTRLPSLRNNGGSALDWFYHDLKVKYAYQIKLRDTGSYGFLIPKEHIIPTGREVFGAINYLGRFLLGEIGIDHDVEDHGSIRKNPKDRIEHPINAELKRRKR